MRTIKLPYRTDEIDIIDSVIKQYSIVVRWSYNRFKEGLNEKEIRLLSKELNSIELLNSWLIQCAIKEEQAVYNKFQGKKVIFGGKLNFINRLKNKISKDDFKLKRYSPVNIQGECLNKGNRSFNLDIIDNNQIIFKLNKDKRITLYLPQLRNNIKKELFKLQELNNIKVRQKGYTYTVRFDSKFIYISYEEFKNDIICETNSEKYLGIDLNPNAIGISVLESGKVIFTQEFSLKIIFDNILNSKLSSSSDKMKYYQNKLNFETLEISKVISLIAKRFNCASVFIEDLSFKIGDSGKGKVFNRKTKNLWKKELFISNLTKRLSINNIKLYKVNPAYSSFIGNLQHDFTDAVNASIEIGRRGYEIFIKKNKTGFYPSFNVKHHWKETATLFNDWKQFYLEIAKNLKLKYRVSLNDCLQPFNVFQLNSTKKSMITYHTFSN